MPVREPESLRTRTAAFLFWDTVGSTALLSRLGDERAEEVRRRLFSVVREVVTANRGEEVKNTGDGLMVAFSSSLGDSLSCAVGIQRAVAVLDGQFADVELAVRVGIAAGDAVSDAAEGDWFGRSVNTAARLCDAASAHDIFATAALGALTDWNVEPVGPLDLKGLPDPVDTVRVPWTLTDRTAIAVLPPVLQLGEGLPLVGRRDQLAQLDESFGRAVQGETARVRITGPIGCGVTRLAREWLHRCEIGAGQILGASCVDREPFDALAAAIDWHAASRPEGIMGAGPDGLAPLIAAVAPSVARMSGVASTHAPRAEVESALVSHVRRLADSDVVVVVLDDCAEQHHVAMDDLADSLAGRPALVISAGPADVAAPGDIGVLPLTAAEVGELLGSSLSLDAEVGTATAEWIAQETDGVALQVCEVVNTLARERTDPSTVDEARAAVTSAITLSCPWRGLKPLGADDHALFFGRDGLLAELIGAVGRSRVTVVSGMSGSGKSSLIAAGLVPALQLGTTDDLEVWQPIVVTPGRDPGRRLDEVIGTHLGAADGADRAPPGAGLVLIVDQLEEIWTHGLGADERNRFVDRLVALGSQEESDVRIVLGLRSDFLGPAVQHDRLRTVLRDSQILVGTPDVDDLRRMILGPAETTGFVLDHGLVERLLSDVAGETGALPLLSHALYETWRRRQGRTLTLAGYEACGGIEGAIAATAEGVVESMTEAEVDETRHLFNRLITLGEGRADTRRRARTEELTAASRRVAEPFVEARLLSSGEGTIEVSHEALLQYWPRLKGWLSEDRDDLRQLRHLADAAAAWETGERNPADLYRASRLENASEIADRRPAALNESERAFLDSSRAQAVQVARRDRRRRNVMRAAVVALAGLLVVSVVAGLFAVGQRRRAEDEAAVALTRQREAELAAITSSATQLADENRAVAHTLALEAYRRDPGVDSQRALLAVLAAHEDLEVLRSPVFEQTGCDVVLLVTDSEIQYALGPEVFAMSIADATTRSVGRRPDDCATVSVAEAPGDPSFALAGGAPGSIGPRIWVTEDPATTSGWGEPIELTGRVTRWLPGDNGALLHVAPEGERGTNYYWVTADRRVVPLSIDDNASENGTALPRRGLAFIPSRSGSDVLGQGDGRFVRLETGETVGTIEFERNVMSVAPSVDGRVLAVATDPGDTVTIHSSETFEKLATLPASVSQAGIEAMALDETGAEIAVQSQGEVGIYSVASGERTAPLLTVEGVHQSMTLLPDHRIRLWYADGSVQILAAGSSPLVTARQTRWGGARVDLNREGTVAAGVEASTGEVVRIDLETGETLRFMPPPGLGPVVAAIPVGATGTVLVGVDTRMARFDGDSLVEELPAVGADLLLLAGDAAGNSAAALVAVETGGERYVIWVADLDRFAMATEPLIIDFNGADSATTFMPMAIPRPDGGVIVVNPVSKSVEFYDAALGLEWSAGYANEPRAIHNSLEPRDLSVDPTGDRLLFTTGDRAVRLAEVGREEARVIDSGGRAVFTALSPDGERAVVVDEGGVTTLWDVEQAIELGPLAASIGTGGGEPRWSLDGSEVTIVGTEAIVRVATKPARWATIACELIGRPPDQRSWETHAPPGIDLPPDCSTD